MALEAIKFENRKLLVLNQLLLPFETSYDEVSTVEEGWKAIKYMKVRGAPAISIVAALSLAVELNQKEFDSKQNIFKFVTEKLHHLLTSRPTAVNLDHVVKFLIDLSKHYLDDETISVNTMKEKLILEAEKLLESDISVNKKIGEYGGKDILEKSPAPVSVLTHCNTGSLATAGYGTALGVIRWLHENGNLEHAYCTETRPYNQGARLTAYELLYEKIPSTLICDSMVAYLMKSRKISAVIVGADRVASNGDTANKIGTYHIAIAAKYHNIPFYVACPRSSFDFSLSSGEEIPIEERPSCELITINSVPIAVNGINCWNPAFDVTPADLITGGIITEVGVFAPENIENNLEELSQLDFSM